MYDPKRIEVLKKESVLPSDVILDAVITDVRDGKVKDFAYNIEKWKGTEDNPAIHVSYEGQHQGQPFSYSEIYTYVVMNGLPRYSAGSKLGHFVAKYGQAPAVGVKVKAMTNEYGWPKTKLK